MLEEIYHIVWGYPLLILVTGVGLYLTLALRGLQFRYLFAGLRAAFGNSHDKNAPGDLSHFQSLMTALAATIGIGNIAGVATAMVSGGLGAVFWMWVMACIGMVIKYAEACLAVKYRIVDAKGNMAGGPMYFIERGLSYKKLAIAFAFFGVFAAIGGGNMLQANSVADVLRTVFSLSPSWTAVVLAIATALSILGGIKSIGKIASFLVPFMALIYVSGAVFILFCSYDRIPHVLWTIVTSAFTGQAAFGGFLGATVQQAIQTGVARALMTSEAGLGTASIAAASAKTDLPARQALVSMTGSFLATCVMCSATALVLGVTNAFGTIQENGMIVNGASMTVKAFESVMPHSGYIVSVCLVLFAFTTLLGWAYYGEQCIVYLFGTKATHYFRMVFILFVGIGAVLELEVVWKVSDIFNGLMAFPNLIGVLLLSPVVIAETRVFLDHLSQEQKLKEQNLAV